MLLLLRHRRQTPASSTPKPDLSAADKEWETVSRLFV